jgi:hypothetical protein
MYGQPDYTNKKPEVQNYQSAVAGLQGWNDPPQTVFASDKDDPILSQVKDPVGYIVAGLTETLSIVKQSQVRHVTFS